MHISSSTDGWYLMSDTFTGIWTTDCISGPYASHADAQAALSAAMKGN